MNNNNNMNLFVLHSFMGVIFFNSFWSKTEQYSFAQKFCKDICFSIIFIGNIARDKLANLHQGGKTAMSDLSFVRMEIWLTPLRECKFVYEIL